MRQRLNEFMMLLSRYIDVEKNQDTNMHVKKKIPVKIGSNIWDCSLFCSQSLANMIVGAYSLKSAHFTNTDSFSL